MRTAFLDTKAKLVEIAPFELETNDEVVSLHVTNTRRMRGIENAISNEGNVLTEQTYHLDLYVAARSAN